MKSSLIKAVNVVPLSESEMGHPGLNLDVYESSIISLIGSESSGKTLWLKTLNGFNAMAQGELNLLNYNVRKLNREDWLNLQIEVSYVGQDTALLSAYTLMENILLPALYHKLGNRDELTQMAYSLLEEAGFTDFHNLNQLPAFVKPLQNYYVKLVRALIVSPRLLFLDDLFSHLSTDKLIELKAFLIRKVKESGLSIVLATDKITYVIDESTTIVFVSPDAVHVYESKGDMLESVDVSLKEFLSRNGIH